MALDVHVIGYAAVAMYNTLHRNGKIGDINLLLKDKDINDELSYQAVYSYFLNALITAADDNQPYTEVLSTQPLFLPALCDAVIEYNQKYLPKKNSSRTKLPPIQPVEIHQYLTDLPSIGCDHYLSTFTQLTPLQKQQMRVYALNLQQPIFLSYFENGKDFKGVHNIPFKDNPMIRKGFKDPSLKDYLNHDLSLGIQYKTYTQNKDKTSWLPNADLGEIVIPAKSKVAAIMLSSLGSNTTVDYIRELLTNDYDQIFVFGGLGDNIYPKVQEIINAAPLSERNKLRNRIILLGNQDDTTVAPIMTRSDCVIIRGGISGMEQAALPSHPNKAIFFDQANTVNYEALGPDINWEDGNAEELIAHFKTENVYAKRTSPQQFTQDLASKPAIARQCDSSQAVTRSPIRTNEEVDIGAWQERREAAASSSYGAGRFLNERHQSRGSRCSDLRFDQVRPSHSIPVSF